MILSKRVATAYLLRKLSSQSWHASDVLVALGPNDPLVDAFGEDPDLMTALLESMDTLGAVRYEDGKLYYKAASSLSSLEVERKNESPSGSHSQARQNGNTIFIFDSYFELPARTRQHVLFHELGHWFRQWHVPLKEIMGWESGDKFNGLFGTFDSEEGFAEAFAVFFMEPRDLRKRYPEQYDQIQSYLLGQESAFRRWVSTQLRELQE